MIAEFIAAMVDGAMQAAPTVTRRTMLGGSSDSITGIWSSLEPITLAFMRGAGFVEVQTERAVFDSKVTIWARHRCGSWARGEVPDRVITWADERPAPFVAALDEMGCYCAPREVKT